MAHCMFTRHTPSLKGEGFDVLITLAGNASDGREETLARIVRDATTHITPVRPTVRVEYLHVAKDEYDKDHSKARQSSYAGPNTVFYSLMAGDKIDQHGHATAKESGGDSPVRGDKASSSKSRARTASPPGTRAVIDDFMPPAPNADALHARHIAPYTYVQIAETDCCALKSGWLDVLLAPMLTNPNLLISGSRARAACYSADDTSACEGEVDAHLRLHINGNAMYRTGHALQALVQEARNELLDVAPFDLAMYFVRKKKQSHVHDNPRVYSVAAPVDAALWDEPAYYGLDNHAVLVHAPRRLRQDGLQSVASRVDDSRPIMAVVVAPSSVTPQPVSNVSNRPANLTLNVPLLHSCHQAMHAARAGQNLIYIALTWPAFVEASRLAPFRVLLANGTRKMSAEAWPDPAVLASRALTAVAALARADLSTLVMGTDAAMVRSGVDVDLFYMDISSTDDVNGLTLRLLQSPSGAAPLAPVVVPGQPDLGILDVGLMHVPPGEPLAAFLHHWADELQSRADSQTRAAGKPVPWHRADGVMAALANCKVWRWADCFWRGANLTADWLPAEAYASGGSYFGPYWSTAARKEAAFVVAAGVAPVDSARTTSPEFRLRQAGLWHGPAATGCANYSAVSRKPITLGPDVVGVHRALALHAAFFDLVARHHVTCAILPGFTLASTGNAIPYDAVLRADVVASLSQGSRPSAPVRFFPNASCLDVPYDSFVDLVSESDGAHACHRRHGVGGWSGGAAAGVTTRQPGDKAGPTVGPVQAGMAVSTVTPPPTQNIQRSLLSAPALALGDARKNDATSHACAVFGLAGTSCFAPDVAAAIDAAAHALPPRIWCVADPGRSLAEAAVLALEGRLHEVDAVARQVVGEGDAALLLTGPAWRATAAARAAGDRGVQILTLADLPGVASADPLAKLVRPDTPAPLTSAAASPWADVIEYALCHAAAGVRSLPSSGVPGLLLPRGTPPSTLLPRLAARVPPSLIEEDLDAFSRWLARPDRPGLGGRWVRTRWARAHPASESLQNSSASSAPPPRLTPLRGAQVLTAATRYVNAMDLPLGFVPGLPTTSAQACTDRGQCQPTGWSSVFGPVALREVYRSSKGRLLPPAVAVLVQPDAALDVFRGDGVPVVVGGPDFPASARQVHEPCHLRAAATVRRILDAQTGTFAGRRKGISLCRSPPSMWVDSALAPDRLARLQHFVGEGSAVVLDHEL